MMPPDLRRAAAAERRARAGAELIQRALDQRHVPGAGPTVPAFVDALAHLYGVRRWSAREYERAFARGALAGWQPGVRVVRAPVSLAIVSPICPLASEVEFDPGACQACQAFQADVAASASAGELSDARFEETITRGDATCTVTFRKSLDRSE